MNTAISINHNRKDPSWYNRNSKCPWNEIKWTYLSRIWALLALNEFQQQQINRLFVVAQRAAAHLDFHSSSSSSLKLNLNWGQFDIFILFAALQDNQNRLIILAPALPQPTLQLAKHHLESYRCVICLNYWHLLGYSAATAGFLSFKTTAGRNLPSMILRRF